MAMPNFLIIGTGRAGTTSLYNYLGQHPEIYMSPVKEPNFFGFEGEKKKNGRIANLENYKELFKNVYREKAIGEASIIYLSKPKAAEQIKRYIPKVKLIVILRDPADKLYSNFMHRCREGKEKPDSFSNFLKQIDTGSPEYRRQHLERNSYYRHLKHYFKLFDRSQIKIFLYEDLQTNPFGLLRDIFRFLDVDENFLPDISIRHNPSGLPKNTVMRWWLVIGRKATAVIKQLRGFLPKMALRFFSGLRNRFWAVCLVKPSLSPEARRKIVDLYRQDILELEKLIQRDLSNWLK